jgi:hypothetical protein
MKPYTEKHMLESLAEHVLVPIAEWTGSHGETCHHFLMRRPGTGMMHLHLIFAGGHISLFGDLTIGGRHGCISAGGYGLEWFVRQTTDGCNSYLCSKFLEQKWQAEAAIETLEEWAADPDREHSDAIREIIETLKDGEIGPEGLYHALYDVNPYLADDGVPGTDYPRGDAGWLCAAQQRFAELYATLQAVESAEKDN